jgi:hypothetical protein
MLLAALCQLRHLRWLLPVAGHVTRSLRLKYGNFILVGLPIYHQQCLQSVLNAAARVVFRIRRYDHVSDALLILL